MALPLRRFDERAELAPQVGQGLPRRSAERRRMPRRAEQGRGGVVAEQRQPGPPSEQHRHGRQQADAERDAELVRPALGWAEFAA
jgi:hypothetical protein